MMIHKFFSRFLTQVRILFQKLKLGLYFFFACAYLRLQKLHPLLQLILNFTCAYFLVFILRGIITGEFIPVAYCDGPDIGSSSNQPQQQGGIANNGENSQAANNGDNARAGHLLAGVREALGNRIDLLGNIFGWPVTPQNKAAAIGWTIYSLQMDLCTRGEDIEVLQEFHDRLRGNEQGLADAELGSYYEPMMEFDIVESSSDSN